MDAIIVNLGDSYRFHAGVIPILLHTAPMLVLHDADLSGFTTRWRQVSGADGWRVDRFAPSPGSIAPYCGLACGVVVHGPHYEAAARDACGGPVTRIPLCWISDPTPAPFPPGETLIIATIGHVNANKRADAVIRALGASPRLRDRALYVLAGQVDDDERKRLEALARRVGARAPQFTGWLPDEMLQMVLACAHVVSCLRNPALEGASASMILALRSGRPTLVSDHASYADLPDDVVLKCAPGDEASGVMYHLEAILDDWGVARRMGERAQAYAAERHSPAAYVDQLLPALTATIHARPVVQTSIAIGRRLADFGMQPDDPATQRLDAVLAGMLGSVEGSS